MSLQKNSYLGFTPTHWDDVQKEVFGNEATLHHTSHALTHLADKHEGSWSWWHRNGFRDPFARDAAIKARCPQRPIWYEKKPAGFGTYEATDKVAALYTGLGREGFLDRANEMPAKGTRQSVQNNVRDGMLYGTLCRSESLPALYRNGTIVPPWGPPVSERDLPFDKDIGEQGDVRDPRLFRTPLPNCCYDPAHRTRLGLI